MRETGSTLLKEMLGQWQLRQQLRALRDLYLGGSQALLGFSHCLIERLLEGESLVSIPEADLQDSLDSCLESSFGRQSLPQRSHFEGE